MTEYISRHVSQKQDDVVSSVCGWYLIKPHEQNEEENPGPDMNVNDPYRRARL